MPIRFSLFLLLGLLFHICTAQVSPSFPQGKIEGPFVWKSDIYPGTERNYWLYVPAQYDAKEPACVMVVQDGLGRAKGWRLPEVLDSLIALKEVPVMIGIFVDHGKVPSDQADAWPRFNRCFEYDALGDRYAHFLLEELLPEVEKSYTLSDDPNDRSIAGASSGAICAFNVAWERPDAFRRVLSTIGTYVGLRGGEEFPTLIRKTEPKPLRVFLEDGTSDLNIYAGDWWMANQDMLSALTWAGYEVNHIWGKEGHNSKGAKAIMPQALAWLWQDYPQAIQTHPDKHQGKIALPEEDTWKKVGIKLGQAARLAVNPQGDISVSDSKRKTIQQINEAGKVIRSFKVAYQSGGICFDSTGTCYLADLDNKVIRVLDEKGKGSVLIKKVYADHLVCSPLGLYWTDPLGKQVAWYSFANQEISYIKVDAIPMGLSLTTDQTSLQVSLAQHVFGYSFKIAKDGSLAYGQAFTHYHIPYGEMTAQPQGMTADMDNFSYTATAMGIQLADPLGRINLIYSIPDGEATDITFGGATFDILYLICDGKLFMRKMETRGVLSPLPPAKVKKPDL